VNVAVRVSCGHRCRAGFCFDDPWRFLGWLSFGPIQVCYFCFLTGMRGLIIGPIRAQVSNDKKLDDLVRENMRRMMARSVHLQCYLLCCLYSKSAN
jgi:hypothetical protein